MFPAPAPPPPADFDPFPAPPRIVGKGGFPAPPRRILALPLPLLYARGSYISAILRNRVKLEPF